MRACLAHNVKRVPHGTLHLFINGRESNVTDNPWTVLFHNLLINVVDGKTTIFLTNNSQLMRGFDFVGA